MKLGLIFAVTGVIALLVDWLRPNRHVLPVPWNWIVSLGLLVVGAAIMILDARFG